METINKIKFRPFAVGDAVEYHPYENCSETAVAHRGVVIEIIDQYTYKVRFGCNPAISNGWFSIGKYNYSNLFIETKTVNYY